MKFTKEAWENAPEGARLEYFGFDWKPVFLIGFSTTGRPVVEDGQGSIWACADNGLRIILPNHTELCNRLRDFSGLQYGDCREAAELTVMEDDTYQALRDAVNLARQRNIRNLNALKSALLQRGHNEQHVNDAIKMWADYEKVKQS